MRMSFRQTLKREQRLVQRQTMEQRQRFELRQCQVHMELLHAIRDEQFDPRAGCPKCQKQLTIPEILRGFNRDPNDLTTECPKCHTRFPSQLVCTPRLGVSIEMPFYCPSQTLANLPGLQGLAPDALLAKHPAVGRSAIVHFGSLRNAFARACIAYVFAEKFDWRDKVVPFLGKLPDSDIASAVNVTSAMIRRLRIKHGIAAFSRRDALETVEV